MNILFIIFAAINLVALIAGIAYTGISALSLFLLFIAALSIASFVLKKKEAIKKILCVLSAFSLLAIFTLTDAFIINK